MPLPGMGRDPTGKPEWGAMVEEAHPLAQGLANWFVLNEGGGAPRDMVGGAGSALTAGIGWAGSDVGSCLVKNSTAATTTDYFDTGLRISSGSGTIVFRVYPTAAYNSGTVEQLWGAAQVTPTNIDFGCQKYSNNNLYVGWYNNGTEGRPVIAASASNWAQNQWQTYALAWSASGSALYRNGVQIGSTSTAPPAAAISANIYLFNRGGSAQNVLSSGTKISDWAYYNRALTGGEVAALYAQPYSLLLAGNVRRFYTSVQAWQQLLSETLVLSDVNRFLVSKIVSEALGWADGRASAANKAFNESMNLADVLAAVLNGGGQALSKLLTEAVAWSDTRMAQMSKAVAGSLNLMDSRVLGLARRIGETLGFTDGVQATGAGLAVLTLVTSGAFGDLTGKAGQGDGVRETGGKA